MSYKIETKQLIACDNDKYLTLRLPVMSEPGPEQEQSKIVQLLLRLQEDFKLLAEFDKEPDKVMVDAGISSEADRDILKTRDILKIHQLLEKKKPSNGRKKQQEKT